MKVTGICECSRKVYTKRINGYFVCVRCRKIEKLNGSDNIKKALKNWSEKKLGIFNME